MKCCDAMNRGPGRGGVRGPWLAQEGRKLGQSLRASDEVIPQLSLDLVYITFLLHDCRYIEDTYCVL